MTETTGKKSIFPYLVVLTGIMCCFGPCAFALSCAGIYFTPVSEALGVGRGAFAVSFWGVLVDAIGFTMTFSVVVACIAVLIVLGLASLAAAKKFADEM